LGTSSASKCAGAARPDSDIDIAFLADGPLDPRARFALQETLAIALGRSVDLVDLRSASTVMASAFTSSASRKRAGMPSRSWSRRGDSRHPYPNLDIVRSIVRERIDDFIEFARVVLRG